MKKLTTQIKKIWGWIANQFKTHPVRSVAVTVPAVALITLGILFLCGVFNRSGNWSYLPNRAYILAPVEEAEPQTLYELLHSNSPSVDTLLRNPSIADEIINAESLIDIIDGRFALNNLRELDRQINERLMESPEDVYLLDLPTDDETMAGLPSGATSQTIPVDTLSAPGDGLSASGDQISASADWLPASADTTLIANASQANRFTAASAKVGQSEQLLKVSDAMERLLVPTSFGDVIELSPAISIKGVWQNGEVLLHMTPSADWLPDDGYELYRTVNGESQLVESGIAATAKILSGDTTITIPYTDEDGKRQEASVKEVFESAALTSQKLSTLGMTVKQFNQSYYVTDKLGAKPRVTGANDFRIMRDMQITIPGMIEQKVPDIDFLVDSPIYVMDKQPNSLYSVSELQFSVYNKFSVKQTNILARSELMLSPSAGQSTTGQSTTGQSMSGQSTTGQSAVSDTERTKRELVREVLDARRQITTLSYAEKDFAEEAKFLIHDDLKALGLPDGTVITYTAQSPDGSVSASLEITIGLEFKLSQPTGLDGFGMDGRVPLRWDEAASQEELNIIIGYNIERKLDGESGFKKINDVPVAISHMLDDSDLYMESVIFYEDEVANGRAAQYRVCALDIFGRASEYSEVLVINKDSRQVVEKVTPPNAPSVSAPKLSTAASGSAAGGAGATDSVGATENISATDSAVQTSIDQNAGKKGVVLPIFTTSYDTARFTIYRAVAVGAGGFSKPEVLANISFDNPIPEPTGIYTGSDGTASGAGESGDAGNSGSGST